MQFVLNPENISNMLTEIIGHLGNGQNCNERMRNWNMGNTTSSSSCCMAQNWTETVDLSAFPTKPENLHTKMDAESRIMSISGKSEVNNENSQGFQVFSTHIWSKDLKIPKNVDLSTLDAKLKENKLTITALYKFEKIDIQMSGETQIPAEKLD